ncbi:MAG: type IV secretion system DNA-binding domain-containing protein [Acetobacteraceae bacterium]|nr:type IV secretion system DNA-binding domain-containing protein [Acetobacteraceae bacterium]
MNEVLPTPPFPLDSVSKAGFRGSAEADAISNRLREVLGLGHHYVPARLAIARSLSMPSAPPPAAGEAGRTIDGEQLFGSGSDLAAWVSLIIEHAGRAPADLAEFRGLVRAHWVRGMSALGTLLDRAEDDPLQFWRLIAEDLPQGLAGVSPPSAGDGSPAPVPTAVRVPVGEIGEDQATGEQVLWRVNGPGGSPHAAIMGGVGSGKTRTAVAMLRAIRAATPVPLIAFDFKGDMADDKNQLDRAFEATVLSPPRQPIPLDVLHLADRTPTGITLAAQRLRDGLATLKGGGFGAKQKGWLADAAENALRTHDPCTLAHVRDALRAVYAQNNQSPDGALNTLEDLCRLPLFEPRLGPADFFARSWIIRLTQDLPDLVRVTVVTLLTDALDRYLNSLPDAPTDASGNRALRVLCVIDEAHRILDARLPGLSGLVRLSRSKGGAVMLISQGPDDFEGVDDDFLNEMGLVVAFRTNAEAKAVKRILGTGAKLAALQTGQAWVKIGGEASARRVLAWR